MRQLTSALLLISGLAFGQSPKNLKADVKLPKEPTYTSAPNGFPVFDTPAQVVNAFNYARRQEEKQMKLPANSLGTLSLPEKLHQTIPGRTGVVANERGAKSAGGCEVW